ncbi:nuclear transport factor 2 family protein [uncultured Aquimarina sp.]|uniref:nuclear transport factor 2 family protein n=1 Tax=uncultured Aquimarina sp. TaxID=575652 RepID=UPI002624B523|nr:nuclear transport factor 2 family protein [uncultured Aquimarina sp.]
MKHTIKLTLVLMTLFLSHCAETKKAATEAKTIMEVTTFEIKGDVDPLDFKKRDAQIEKDFTSKQPGFIKRQSAIDKNGTYVVIVYWKNTANAAASMSKFMSDTSVADYAQMINGSTMKMERYAMDKTFNADKSKFVEVMTFDLKHDTDVEKFNQLNQKVETDFTGKRDGFLQRLTGINEKGKQAVAIYWTTKEASDASLDGFMANSTAKDFMSKMDQSSMFMGRYEFLSAYVTKKEKVVALLNSFNTGDQTPISYINPQKYIQHNLDVGDGLAGFGEVMKNAPESGFKANIIRAFEDEDYVFTHTEYDFFGPKAGFDIFKFEDGLIIEHWDNLLAVQKPNPSGHTQFDGATKIKDLDKTEANKTKVKDFIEKVLLNGEMDKITNYINPKEYIQHNPAVADGLEGFGEAMKYFAKNGLVMEYQKLHMVVGEGNFVLAVSEGKFGKGDPTAFYDLFRLENGLIVEHWDVITTIPPKSEWKNENGKF